MVLTDHNVRLSCGFLNHIRGVEVTVHELRIWILGFHGLGSLFVAYEQRVGVVWVSLLQGVENVATDVA